MYRPTDKQLWQGRVDTGDDAAGRRWHQVVTLDAPGEAAPGRAAPGEAGIALLGLASDAGVVLNHGRGGADEGPAALRRGLANFAWHHELALYDAGDVLVSGSLQDAQSLYAQRLASLLGEGHFVLGLGGGHEIGWGSFLGGRQHLDARETGRSLGVLNLDAHFDLRTPAPHGNSGTPFYQMAQYSEERGQAFHYACIGVSGVANTRALFERADSLGVDYLLDVHLTLEAASELLRRFLARVDCLYLTCCLDVFPAAAAPGVSAPASLGVDPKTIVQVIRLVGESCRQYGVDWLLADVAELSPRHDIDGRTARLAARVVDEMVCSRFG